MTRPAVSVLVVDDHVLLANSVMSALRRQGFDATSVHPDSPVAVLDEAERVRPKVVLLDLDFGSALFSGLDLIHPLTELGIAVVVLTGWQDRSCSARPVSSWVRWAWCASPSLLRGGPRGGAGRRRPARHGPVERDALSRELREHRTRLRRSPRAVR